MKTIQILPGEIVVKASADRECELEGLQETLSKSYKIMSRSRMFENDKDGGLHVFIIIAPMEDEGFED